MTNRLAIMIVVGALLAVGVGYVVLRVVFAPGGPQNSTQQSPQRGTVIVPVVVTTTPNASTTSSQGQSSPIIEVASVQEAYANLLSQLQAREMPFESVSVAAGPFGPVYSMYGADIAEAKKMFPKARDFSLRMARVDLNDDGTAEILVYENLPGFCGTAGCLLEVYQNNAGTWQLIFSRLSLGEPALANIFTSGYNDLFVSVQVDGFASNVVRYSWNGKTYGPKEAVATWDGTQFSPPQL